ncbi:MAG: phosphoribosylaminoimidazolesuccinocarboxamide synthase, partial [Proteobacteria bacterium]|nr:phosphoribosylaminoimidazolesuccinocarboxamide synthase [Pseudomonadota bacterium]
MANEALHSSNLGDTEFFKRGKVREIYNLQDKFLMIATDRISCFDVVLPTLIPQKGAVLTTLSVFWFGFTSDIIPNHFISANTDDFPAKLRQYEETLRGRSMLVKKANPLP